MNWKTFLVRVISTSVLLFFILPGLVDASLLYLDPTGAEYRKGSTFVVTVRLDPEGECVNAVNAVITYPTEELTAFDVSRSGSILSLWVEEPYIDEVNGKIYFQGGIPNGYCGRIDGDPGNTNIIGRIAFRKPGGLSVGGASEGGVLEVAFDEEESEALANDGRGTPTDLTFQNGTYIISPDAPLTDDSVWFNALRDDRIPPESFTVTLHTKDDIQKGKYFVVFSTTDKQSGLDEYQIMEESIDNPGFVEWKKNTRVLWEQAKSPYVLKDQNLNSVIRVKAIDKAGNERIAAYVPGEDERPATQTSGSSMMTYAGGVLLVLVLILIGFIIRKRVNRRKTSVGVDTPGSINQEK
ncbi:MAG: hypothetical protein WDZ88_02970 [Candidatus Paceibacterota bacterium]